MTIRSYPAEEYLGLIFAYLGAGAAPPLPRYPELEEDGEINVGTYIRHCNYFNTLENGIDQAHVPFTHAKSNFTKFGLNWNIPKITAEETDYGVAMYGTRANGVARVNHYVMPNILYIKGSPESAKEGWREAFAWRVPVDDVSHRSFNIALMHVSGDAALRFRARQRRQEEIISALPSANVMAAAALAGQLSVHDIEERPDLVNIQDHVAKKGRARFPTEQLSVSAARIRRLSSCGRSGGVSCARWARGNLSNNGPAPGDWSRRAACEENSLGADKPLCTPAVLSAGSLRRSAVFGFGETPEQLISAAKNEKELFHRRSDDFRRQEGARGNRSGFQQAVRIECPNSI